MLHEPLRFSLTDDRTQVTVGTNLNHEARLVTFAAKRMNPHRNADARGVRCGRDVVAVLAAERENPAEDTLENDLQLLGVMSSFLAWPAQRIKPGIGKREQSLSGGSAKLSLTRQVENFERELIIKALKITRGNQTKAADLLGVSLRIINYRIGKLNLDYRHFRKES